MTATDQAVRRRASRAAGPAGGAAETTTVRVEKSPEPERAPRARKAGPPPRKQPHRRLVVVAALVFLAIATSAVGTGAGFMWYQTNQQEQAQARQQRFVDTAVQTLVNMYTFSQDTLDQDVDRFYSGISGQLRDEWAQDNRIEKLKKFLRATGNNSEAVVNGAALENLDNETKTATVLVSLRVTQSDMNGNNKPSQPMRWRVWVEEDLDTGELTASDMRYPAGSSS